MSTGTANSSGSRVARGNANCGFRDFHTPERGVMVSLMKDRPMACAMNTTPRTS